MASNIQAKPEPPFDLSPKAKAIFKCYLFYFLEKLIDQGADDPPPNRQMLKENYELFDPQEFAAISDTECRQIAEAREPDQRKHLDETVANFIKAFSKLSQEDKNGFIELFAACFIALEIRGSDEIRGGRYTLTKAGQQFLSQAMVLLSILPNFGDLSCEDSSFEDRVDAYMSEADRERPPEPRQQAGMATESYTDSMPNEQSSGSLSLSRSSALTYETGGSGSFFASVRGGIALSSHSLLSRLT